MARKPIATIQDPKPKKERPPGLPLLGPANTNPDGTSMTRCEVFGPPCSVEKPCDACRTWGRRYPNTALESVTPIAVIA